MTLFSLVPHTARRTLSKLPDKYRVHVKGLLHPRPRQRLASLKAVSPAFTLARFSKAGMYVLGAVLRRDPHPDVWMEAFKRLRDVYYLNDRHLVRGAGVFVDVLTESNQPRRRQTALTGLTDLTREFFLTEPKPQQPDAVLDVLRRYSRAPKRFSNRSLARTQALEGVANIAAFSSSTMRRQTALNHLLALVHDRTQPLRWRGVAAQHVVDVAEHWNSDAVLDDALHAAIQSIYEARLVRGTPAHAALRDFLHDFPPPLR